MQDGRNTQEIKFSEESSEMRSEVNYVERTEFPAEEGLYADDHRKWLLCDNACHPCFNEHLLYKYFVRCKSHHSKLELVE